MAAYFFDSSALAKCYINEVGSSWVRRIARPAAANDIHILQLTEVEITSAVVRRRKAGTLSPGNALLALAQFMRDLANDYIVLDISESLLSGAVALVRLYELRAYDAMQLAAAVALNQARIDAGLAEIILVSADLELNSAAQSERIVVEDPSDHP